MYKTGGGTLTLCTVSASHPGHTCTGKPGCTWPADLAFAWVDAGEYNDPEILKSFFDADKPVARICMQPAGAAFQDAEGWIWEFLKVLRAKAPVT
ncbi:conserved hypothetical protein [Streptomyces sviceus ATCC 29083]|uniref:Uncharacterized protein n=1 Tax=Streptomyces sviceus (strain ATCC 29083 / DSM 924 / JCM 4929 / NBRC 13980 / NCIMB 11184 / NRRL 5439 / UC 5370) TaxID=463191 RepID=B5I833_STRX2|nr:conserved hypothetical protein [Streptomyces sviceus ATCC 29083]